MVDLNNCVAIGGTGNHTLDVGILKTVNDLGRANINFLHLDMDEFPDREPDFRIQDWCDIRDKHVLIFQSAHSNGLKDQFLEIAWGAKRQYGAKDVTAILPFMFFRRQENAQQQGEINRNLMFVQDMASRGVARLVLCDIHSNKTLEYCAQEGIEVFNADPTEEYRRNLSPLLKVAQAVGREVFIYTPDYGSLKRAVPLAKSMDLRVVIDLKKRKSGDEVEVGITAAKSDLKKWSKEYGVKIILAEDLPEGSDVVIREDEIATGSTASDAGRRLKNSLGANEVTFVATHAVCTPGWRRKFIDKTPFDHIFLGNTIPRTYNKSTGGMAKTVDMAETIGSAVFELLSTKKE